MSFPASPPSPWVLPRDAASGEVGSGGACSWVVIALLFFACSRQSRADPVFYPGEEIAAQDLIETMNDQEPGTSWFDQWHRMTAETKERQPDWMNPIVTASSRIDNAIRYDVYNQTLSNGHKKYDFGAGKGVSLIVTPTDEFSFSLPNYIYEPGVAAATGWRGEVLELKHRIISSPQNQHNYVFSAQLSALTPTGAIPGEPNHWIWTPMLLFGKGWGNFNCLINFGTQWADGADRELSEPFVWNVAFEYWIGRIAPCIEFTSEAAVSAFEVFGPPGIFVLPELLLGRFDLRKDMPCSFGVGYQIGMNKSTIDTKYDNALIVKLNLLF